MSIKKLNLETAVWAVIVLAMVPYILYFVPQLFGVDAYIVTSGSMAPAIPEGSVVFEKEPEINQLSEGDIVIFRPENSQIEGETVVHRIVDVKTANYTRHFKTKGDANNHTDPGWTPSYNIVGQEIISIPFLGTVIQTTNTIPFIAAIVGLPSIILLKSQIENLMDALETDHTSQDGRIRKEG